jgi:putative membrane protein
MGQDVVAVRKAASQGGHVDERGGYLSVRTPGPAFNVVRTMKNFLIRLLVNAAALSAAAWVVGGIQLTGGLGSVLVVALLFGIVNALLKPVLVLLSIPFIVLTLGFFALVVNGALLLITASLTDHLAVAGLGSAILGSIVMSVVTMLLGRALKDGEDR